MDPDSAAQFADAVRAYCEAPARFEPRCAAGPASMTAPVADSARPAAGPPGGCPGCYQCVRRTRRDRSRRDR